MTPQFKAFLLYRTMGYGAGLNPAQGEMFDQFMETIPFRYRK